jgi:hypothetical protein
LEYDKDENSIINIIKPSIFFKSKY